MSLIKFRSQYSFLSFFLVILHLGSTSSYCLNNPDGHQSVVLNRTGHWRAEHEAVYPFLVKRIQKWIENLEPMSIQVSPIEGKFDKSRVKLDRVRKELNTRSEILKSGLFMGEPPAALSEKLIQMVESRKRASGQADLGPDIQKSLMIEAAYHWKMGEFTKSQSTLVRAIRIHPTGAVPSFIDWDNLDSQRFNCDAFDTFVAKVLSREPRQCRVELQFAPAFSSARVNGFEIELNKNLMLPTRSSHHLEVSAEGFQSQRFMVSCDSAETKKLKVDLALDRHPPDVTGESGSKRQSMILVEPEQDRFKLLLYSPGIEIDEIPLKQPLKLADLSSLADSSTGPIATDAAIAIFQKHKQLTMDLKLPETGFDSRAYSVKNSIEAPTRKNSWIQSPVFWGIVGGILAGGAIAYFAQSKNSTSANNPWE